MPDPRHAGLVVDTDHILVRGGPRDLDGIPPERIALVQCADVAGPVAPGGYERAGRTRRLLPGEGDLPIGGILHRLRALGYAGPMGLEVFNDAMKAQPPRAVARCAFAALLG